MLILHKRESVCSSPMPLFLLLTQCSEDDLPTAESVAAKNRRDRQLVLRVGRQVLEDDGFTLRCHSNDDPVTWIHAWLSSLPQTNTWDICTRRFIIFIKGGGNIHYKVRIGIQHVRTKWKKEEGVIEVNAAGDFPELTLVIEITRIYQEYVNQRVGGKTNHVSFGRISHNNEFLIRIGNKKSIHLV